MRTAWVLAWREGKVLLAKRAPHVSAPGIWSLPGGGVEENEAPALAARREFVEEMGSIPRWLVLDAVSHPDRVVVVVRILDRTWRPRLNAEHVEWGWFNPMKLPAPVHEKVLEQLGMNDWRRGM